MVKLHLGVVEGAQRLLVAPLHRAEGLQHDVHVVAHVIPPALTVPGRLEF